MKKRKILKIILILLIVITLALLIFIGYQKYFQPSKPNVISTNNTDSTKIEKKGLFETQSITYNHCKKENDDNCRYADNTLRHLELTTKYNTLNETISKINNLIDEKINEIKQSNLDSNECSSTRDTYNYRNIYMMSEPLYESKKIIGISYEMYGVDICTNQIIEDTFDSYIYDIKSDKILTQNEILDLYNIKTTDINKTISDNLEDWNKELNTSYTLNDVDNDYKLYLSSEGNLSIYYKIKSINKVYSTTIKKETV